MLNIFQFRNTNWSPIFTLVGSSFCIFFSFLWQFRKKTCDDQNNNVMYTNDMHRKFWVGPSCSNPYWCFAVHLFLMYYCYYTWHSNFTVCLKKARCYLNEKVFLFFLYLCRQAFKIFSTSRDYFFQPKQERIFFGRWFVSGLKD